MTTAAARVGAGLDPDRDEARRWLQEELDSGDYRLQESWFSRVWRWFVDLLPQADLPGTLPAWTTWLVLTLVVGAVLAVIAFATRDRWSTARLRESGPAGAVLEGVRRSAQDYRDSAARALSSGDHDTALLEAYRAIAAGAIERTLLDDRPGSTAHEVALGLGPLFPDRSVDLRRAGDAFDAVRYGDHRADQAQARTVVELDAALAAQSPLLDQPTAPAMAHP